jgi:hypothetical protein
MPLFLEPDILTSEHLLVIDRDAPCRMCGMISTSGLFAWLPERISDSYPVRVINRAKKRRSRVFSSRANTIEVAHADSA